MQQLLPCAAPGLAVGPVEAARADTVLEAESPVHLQERLVVLQQALDCERRQHVLTSAREEQVAGELLAARERLHNTTAALAASQQELSSTLAETDLLHGQMQAANQAAAGLEATAACLTQQLQSAHRWLQHQRQATASAQAAAAASAFGCARLEAELRSLRSKLDNRQQQQQQGQSASSIVAKLQEQNGRLLAERYTALRRCEEQHKQHQATKAYLAAAQQELAQVRLQCDAATAFAEGLARQLQQERIARMAAERMQQSMAQQAAVSDVCSQRDCCSAAVGSCTTASKPCMPHVAAQCHNSRDTAATGDTLQSKSPVSAGLASSRQRRCGIRRGSRRGSSSSDDAVELVTASSASDVYSHPAGCAGAEEFFDAQGSWLE